MPIFWEAVHLYNDRQIGVVMTPLAVGGIFASIVSSIWFRKRKEYKILMTLALFLLSFVFSAPSSYPT